MEAYNFLSRHDCSATNQGSTSASSKRGRVRSLGNLLALLFKRAVPTYYPVCWLSFIYLHPPMKTLRSAEQKHHRRLPVYPKKFLFNHNSLGTTISF